MKQLVIGIDEVGRGPLAGPVAVGLVLATTKSASGFFRRRPLRDSKKMSEQQRKEVFEEIREAENDGKIKYCVKFVSAAVIDRVGINQAIARAINLGLKKLDNGKRATLELDGGLRAPKDWKKFKVTIKGDERIPVVALASIVAKVTRDRLMKKMAKKFPKYGFEQHKGYGTKSHCRALKKFGPTVIHRKTYLKGLPNK